MDLADSDLMPAGASLPRPVLGPHRVPVATFTPAVTPDPAGLWAPFTRTTAVTREGQQGSPLGGYRPGRSIEHEPVNRSERLAMKTAQSAASYAGAERDDDRQPAHVQAAGDIRAALRGI